MDFELFITPTIRLAARQTSGQADFSGPRAKSLAEAFHESPAAGLFKLTARRADEADSPAVAFWREFAQRYLALLCQTPETADRIDAISAPAEDELANLLAGAPPMPGAEYLSASALGEIWDQLDVWVRQQVSAHSDGLVGFLQDEAPLWRQVGRVCFHLAENKRDGLYPFAFLATYSPGLARGARVQYQPLSKALKQYAGENNKEALTRLLSPVMQAARQSEFMREVVASRDIFHPLTWTPKEAHRFLQEVPLYESSGVLVRLPDWWKRRARPQVNVSIGDQRQKRLDTASMLDFKVNLALGDEELSAEEWDALMESEDGLVLLKGQWVEADREKLSAALDHWRQVESASQQGLLTFAEGMRLLAGAPADLSTENGEAEAEQEWTFVRPGQWLSQVLGELRNPEETARAKPNPALQATLRPYQETGVDWLWTLTRLGLGACLADDMGLGKTIQVLALLLRVKQHAQGKVQPSLLVLPASLLANWKAEISRFAPTLKPAFIHASETDKQTLAGMADDPQAALRGVDVALTTYGMLKRQDWLREVEWNLVILDEAQAIKNAAARQTRAVKKLRSASRVALTGTPVENRLSDLWSLFDFLCPGLLGSVSKFKQFVKVLGRREHARYAPLRNLVQPYILRRLKTDKSIIADLPEKSEVTAFYGLSKRQAVLYEKSVAQLAKAMEAVEGIQRRGLVLAYLMRFKQICNHPSQLLGDGAYQPSDSGKFTRLQEICEEVASRQERILLFTQFREMVEPLSEFLAGVFGQPGLTLHGGTAVKKRQRLVDAFQQDDGPPFFVLSLKAGGTGLNLTAASHVIHFDRWWNPAVESQATDRAFRIGQRRNVLVHKFVCRGTIEERIDAMIEEKKQLADDVLAGGAEKMLTEMSDEQLLEMVKLDVNKAMA